MKIAQIHNGKPEADRLKLQMGLSPAIDIDLHLLRFMWRTLEAERLNGGARETGDPPPLAHTVRTTR